jgi:hypothetical protein
MNYLPQLSEEEIRYICSVIPRKNSVDYFTRNPKGFSKIMPGFRPTSLNQSKMSALLFKYRDQYFISSFIEKHIDNWLSQIQKNIAKIMKDGDSKELAFLHTLPFSFFVDNVCLYFKLVNETYSEEYVALLSIAINEIKNLDSKQEQLLKDGLKIKDYDIKKLRTELDSAKSDLEKVGTELNERSSEIKTLKRSVSSFEKLRTIIQNDEEIIASLKAKIQEQEKNIQGLRAELSDLRASNQQLETQIRTELQAAMIAKRQSALKPKRPSDLNEFKDFLGYNLENIGISTHSEYYVLLKEHLSKILFQGIPMVVNRDVGTMLMKCIANALIGQPNVKTATFNKNLSIEDVDSFLSSAGRVVCLDNFIGNCNETELLSLFDNHRNKIIFLTVAYDRTIHYVSEEFLRYCQYLNLNRIATLSTNAELTEDPSKMDEEDYEIRWGDSDKRYSGILKEILRELGFHESLIEKKCIVVFNEQDLCRLLAFDVLPYCIDVLQIAPYNTSERFLKYAGDTGRCQYKKLFKSWFAR